MNKLKRILGIGLLASIHACASSGAADPADPADVGAMARPAEAVAPAPAAARPDGTATFSSAQADRGRDTFRATCTECHYSSEFADSQFKFKWSRRSAGSLYRLIQTSMPETAPGSLSAEQAVGLVTYILRMNGFEPGTGELSADRAVLDAISLASIRND